MQQRAVPLVLRATSCSRLATRPAKLADGSKALGGLTALVGVIAFASNMLSMAMGRDFSGDLPIAGGSGVLATVLLGVCLLTLAKED